MISRRKFISTSALAAAGAAVYPLKATAFAQDNNVVRAGMVGTGARGTGLLTLIKEMRSLKITACCDIIPENLEAGLRLADKGAARYNDYRKLLEDKNIDAVIIATPLYLHYPMAVAALDAGKHVYLEKSMTYNIQQSIDLVRKARQSKSILQVGYQYRNYALYHEAKRVMKENWLGKVTHIECQYNRNSNWRFPVKDPSMERIVNWRMYREYCGGLLSELCSHQIDAVNFFTGSHPLSATAMGGIDYWKDGRETYDNIRAIYEYPTGLKVSVTSVLSNAFNSYRILILGDKATLEILRDKAWLYAETTNPARGVVDGVSGATIAATTQGKPEELIFEKPGQKLPEPTITALEHFVDCIRNNKKPVSNAETAKDSSIAIHMGNTAADQQNVQRWKQEYDV